MFFMPGEFEVHELTTKEKITRVGMERAVMPMKLAIHGGTGMAVVVQVIRVFGLLLLRVMGRMFSLWSSSEHVSLMLLMMRLLVLIVMSYQGRQIMEFPTPSVGAAVKEMVPCRQNKGSECAQMKAQVLDC
jgi:hypothetical protein